MPCYQVRLVSVEFKAQSKELLLKALERLGWSYVDVPSKNEIYINRIGVRLMLDQGIADVPTNSQKDLNRLKQKYSAVVVEKIAKKKRWIIRNHADNKMTARRY